MGDIHLPEYSKMVPSNFLCAFQTPMNRKHTLIVALLAILRQMTTYTYVCLCMCSCVYRNTYLCEHICMYVCLCSDANEYVYILHHFCLEEKYT